MTEFLIAYDYGMGGLWAVVEASNADAITAAYPEVQLVDSRPPWMDDERFDRLERLWLDDDPPQGIFRAILADRHRT